ncbi:T9SS type A sorting domain-containing protein [Aurantibacillus circumpalustris]|uniref:T9SS type A sorting domain-containing protein n=1 Tax=Aurantibacillus circumpalustris TaxID=3036359 RepID=UPI00295B825E|nr:T9SS type A sorting domain-containing protein [Aurantibacillus circumpalustris]
MKKIILLSIISVNLLAQTGNTVKYLDKNKVKARINTVNDKFWNINGNGAASYEVPAGKGRNAMFANSIWIGGLDGGGQLHLAANTYKQSGTDFWPGPLDTTNASTIGTPSTSLYNKLWKIDCNDIANFVTAFNNGSVTANTYTIPADILNYPAKGIGNYQRNMAPFVDVNNNGIYDPFNDGDYPIIKGHQQILSIYNDNHTIHSESQGVPMGIEIHERSYSYSDPNIVDSMQAINYTTFHHYTIYNRSLTSYQQVYLTDWSDVDLGNYGDDYIGSDTINNFAYCYNGDSVDENISGALGYGNKPPVSSLVLLPTNCTQDGIDNNHNGQIDESGEQFDMDLVTYYNNNVGAFPPQTTNPSIATHYYNYMSGRWKDNTPFTFGGNGYSGSAATKIMYPGDPQLNSGWTETAVGNTPGDRRILLSSGPFAFPARSKIEWGFAIVFSQDTANAVNTITEFNQRVQRDVRNVKYYDAIHQGVQCAPTTTAAGATGIAEQKSQKMKAVIYPNPTNGFLNILLNETLQLAQIRLIDISGRTLSESLIENNSQFKLDVSNVEKGIYFVEITSGNKKHTVKIIKN